MQLANQILFIEKSWWWANFSQNITFIIDKNVFLLPGTTVTASSSSFTERSSAIIVVSFENTLISSFFSNKLSLSFDYNISFNGSPGQYSNSVITLPVSTFSSVSKHCNFNGTFYIFTLISEYKWLFLIIYSKKCLTKFGQNGSKSAWPQ